MSEISGENGAVYYNEELARVLIHGILHLFGYEHQKNKTQAQKMRRQEEYYINKVKII